MIGTPHNPMAIRHASLALCALLTAMPIHADSPLDAGPAKPGEIAALVAELSDPSFEKRQAATRRLCAIGMPAVAALETVAGGGDFEAAQRARQVLDVLDDVYFAGVEIELAVSTSDVRWNQPLDLKLSCRNASPYPATLPFERRPGAPSTPESHARQVGDMLDAAEWLRVAHVDKGEVDLRTDDISLDPAVREAVEVRVAAGPRWILPPGERTVIHLTGFNRGWARYPLLDAGDYTLRFEYVPDWTDPVLAEARVGHVASEEIRISVDPGAPAAVSRAGVEGELSVTAKGDAFVALLTNRSDLPATINTNLGVAEPYAMAEWIVHLESRSISVPFAEGPVVSWERFSAERLITLPPGESIELGRVDRKALRARVRAEAPAGADLDHAVLIARYRNPCGPVWQRNHEPALLGNPEVPEVFRVPLPRRLLTMPLSSDRIPLDFD